MFKDLSLLEHLIKNGTERAVEECRDHLHQIRPLQDYNYYLYRALHLIEDVTYGP